MIERLARRTDRRGQFSFAAEAKRRVPERDDVVLAKSHRGLHLLAREEDALAFPLRVLRSAFGSGVAVDRMPGGKPVAEVRVGLEKHHLPQARAALRRRGANPSEEYVGMHYCVLRFEAPLAALLGLPSELAALGQGDPRDRAHAPRNEGVRMTESMSFALPFTALADSREALALAWKAAAGISVAGLLAACGALLARHWRR